MQDQSGQAHDGTGVEGRSLTMPTGSLHSLVDLTSNKIKRSPFFITRFITISYLPRRQRPLNSREVLERGVANLFQGGFSGGIQDDRRVKRLVRGVLDGSELTKQPETGIGNELTVPSAEYPTTSDQRAFPRGMVDRAGI